MKPEIEIPDCVGPRPEFFLDQLKGGMVTAPTGLFTAQIQKYMLPEAKKFASRSHTIYWLQDAYPPALLMAAIFFEN